MHGCRCAGTPQNCPVESFRTVRSACLTHVWVRPRHNVQPASARYRVQYTVRGAGARITWCLKDVGELLAVDADCLAVRQLWDVEPHRHCACDRWHEHALRARLPVGTSLYTCLHLCTHVYAQHTPASQHCSAPSLSLRSRCGLCLDICIDCKAHQQMSSDSTLTVPETMSITAP